MNYTITETGCWNYNGCVAKTGYTRMWDNQLKKSDWGHRVYYRKYKGFIPEGLQIDHLCRNRSCINPEHLEAVSARVNTLRSFSMAAKHFRKTHCPRGHEYNETNSYIYKRSSGGVQRYCKICQIARNNKHRSKTNHIKCSHSVQANA